MSFKPDRVADNYYDYLMIDVPNQKQVKYLYVYGKCFPRSLYVQHHLPLECLPDISTMKDHIESEFDLIRTPDDAQVFSELNTSIVL